MVTFPLVPLLLQEARARPVITKNGILNFIENPPDFIVSFREPELNVLKPLSVDALQYQWHS